MKEYHISTCIQAYTNLKIHIFTESTLERRILTSVVLTSRVEVAAERVEDAYAFADKLHAAFLEMGFEHVILDEEGFVSGKLNRVLQ